MRKMLSITLSCLVVIGMLPAAGFFDAGRQLAGAAYAEDMTEPSSSVEEIAGQLADDTTDPFDYTQESAKRQAIKTADADYPAKFDLRDVDGRSYVTPVKFQDPFGNCWGFAAITAAETSILGNDDLRGDYVADARKEDGIQMDLSEKHLSYFARTPLNDPSDPQNGEGVTPYVGEDEDPVAAAYDMGAHAPTATSLFASGIGPVLESADPLFEYRGRNGTVQKEWVDGRYADYCYSSKDDWYLDESMRFMSSFSLSGSSIVPSPASVEQGLTPYDSTYEYNPAGTAAIKEQLLQKRGVQIGYRDDTFNPILGETCGDYISENWAQYTFIPEDPRHAVTIVGWDDDFDKENFRHPLDEDFIEDGFTEDDTVPPENGAWLVKNSWGSGEEAFPNKGEGYWGIQVPKTDENGDPVIDENGDPVMTGSGYFWLSYYDKSIGTPEALEFDMASADTDIIDQHDFLPIEEYASARTADEVRIANVFRARACEELRYVSCETTYPGTSVTYEIYLLADEHSDPTDGLLMDTVEAGPYEFGGFHKSGLNVPFTVMKGQSYSVVVTQRVPEDSGEESYAFSIQQTFSGTAVINEGESYVQIDGEWRDFGDEEFRNSLLDGAGRDSDSHETDNFPVKAYAKEKPDVVLEVGFSGYMMISQTGAATGNFMAWLTDSSGGDYDVIPEWSIAEGGGDVIELKDGRDPTRKSLLCKKIGGTYVIVTAEGIGTVVYPVIVGMTSPRVTKLKTGAGSLTITTEDDFDTGIEGYELGYREKGSSEWSVRTYGPSNTIVLDKLKKGKKYEISLKYFVRTGSRVYKSYSYEDVSDRIGLANTLKASGKTAEVKYSKLKKAKQTVKRSKAISVSGAKGTVTYTKLSGSKRISVNKKTGKITVKKGLKKGTYRLNIRVKAAGKGSYLPASKKVTVTVRVR